MFHRQTRTTHINNIGTQLIIPLHCGTKKCRIIARLCTERTSTLCHFGWAAPRSNREIQQYKKTQYKGIHLEDDKRRKSRYMTNGHDWVSRNRQEQNRLFAAPPTTRAVHEWMGMNSNQSINYESSIIRPSSPQEVCFGFKRLRRQDIIYVYKFS